MYRLTLLRHGYVYNVLRVERTQPHICRYAFMYECLVSSFALIHMSICI